MSDRQLANESLTSQGIEIPRPDKPEELHYSCGQTPKKLKAAKARRPRANCVSGMPPRWVQASMHQHRTGPQNQWNPGGQWRPQPVQAVFSTGE
jgi:hypothetical protein